MGFPHFFILLVFIWTHTSSLPHSPAAHPTSRGSTCSGEWELRQETKRCSTATQGRGPRCSHQRAAAPTGNSDSPQVKGDYILSDFHIQHPSQIQGWGTTECYRVEFYNSWVHTPRPKNEGISKLSHSQLSTTFSDVLWAFKHRAQDTCPLPFGWSTPPSMSIAILDLVPNKSVLMGHIGEAEMHEEPPPSMSMTVNKCLRFEFIWGSPDPKCDCIWRRGLGGGNKGQMRLYV